MKIAKLAKIIFRQMPAPRAKFRMQKARSGGKFSVQIPGVRGGEVMDNECINASHELADTEEGVGLRLQLSRF